MVLPAQGSQQAPLTLQEQVAEIPTGSIVEVKTTLKNMKRSEGGSEPSLKKGSRSKLLGDKQSTTSS
jgi:hypothetical protein